MAQCGRSGETKVDIDIIERHRKRAARPTKGRKPKGKGSGDHHDRRVDAEEGALAAFRQHAPDEPRRRRGRKMLVAWRPLIMLTGMATETKDPHDAAYWDAVEEPTEQMQEGRFIEALITLRAVIKANPRNPYAYHFLGAALFETGEFAAARDAYRAALRLAPNYLGSRVALSNVLRQLGDLDGALSQAREAVRRFPGDGEAMHAAGLAYAAKGNRKDAKKQLEGFLASNPALENRLEVEQILAMLGVNGEEGPVEFH